MVVVIVKLAYFTSTVRIWCGYVRGDGDMDLPYVLKQERLERHVGKVMN